MFDAAVGNNDGALQEEGTDKIFRFFKCQDKHGVMTSPANVPGLPPTPPPTPYDKGCDLS